MFQDLLDTQDAPLERFLFTSIIPSLLITSFLHVEAVWGWYPSREPPHRLTESWWSIPFCISVFNPDVPDYGESRQVPTAIVTSADVIRIRHKRFLGSHDDVQVGRHLPVLYGGGASYPSSLIEAGIDGEVLVRAKLDRGGRVTPESVRLLYSADPALDTLAIDAVLATQFFQAWLDGRAAEAEVAIVVEFTIPGRRGGHVRHPY